MICLTIFHEMEEDSLKKLVTILFSVLLVFTTQSVSAEDRASGSASGLQAIPVEFIALPVIIILLIAMGYLAKNYSRYRYSPVDAKGVEPATPQKSNTHAPHFQTDHTDNLSKHDNEEKEELLQPEQANIIALPESEGTVKHTPSTEDESPVPKEYKVLQIFAYILIISGLIMKFVIRRKKEKK